MSDFQIQVGGDFSELLRGFQQLEARAQQAGTNVGKGIGEGIQGFSSRSLAALQQELNRLQSRQTRVAVDSSAFEKTGAKIREVQGLIDAVQRQRLSIGVDDRSITALQGKLLDLQNRQTKVSVDGEEFVELQRQIDGVERELTQISQRKVVINADANSLLAITSKLRGELDSLQQRQLRVDIDSQEFTDLGREIDRVQVELQDLERKRTEVSVNSDSLEGLQRRLGDLQQRQTKVSVNSQEFVELQQQINAVEQDLNAVSSRKVLIGADASSVLAVTTRLRGELDSLAQRQLRVSVDSDEFVTLGREIDRIETELAALERKRVTVAVDERSVVALQSRLQDMQSRQVKLDVDSSQFRALQGEIDKVQAELTEVERRKVLINVDANSVTAVTTRLQADLERLQQRQVKINIDSQEFTSLQRQIDQVQEEIAAVERKRLLVNVDARSVTALQAQLQDLQNRQTKVSVNSQEFTSLQRQIDAAERELTQISQRKVLINADPSSVVAMRARLGDLQQELERTAVGSQRFRELKQAIEVANDELARAGESVSDFRLLDGVIQGIAFSLSNSLVEGAGRAISAVQGLIGEFGRLDTEIRLAAAAAGEDGGYDRIARAIDQVGIEAAGTQLEVAQLYTELVRGGMSVDQANASLAAIVRGAEATGTSFAQMGSVVSASIKGFGLEASDATRVVDALVQGANSAAADVSGMGNAFKYAAPVARILGVSVEELGIAVGLLTNAGIDAAEAGVTLRNGFSKLASAAPRAGDGMSDLTGQSALAAKAVRQLGLDIYEADGTLKPMEETLLKLKAAFQGLDPASKVRLAVNLFGGEDDGTKWLALLNQSEEEIKRMSAAMANSAGATDTARDAMQGFFMKVTQLTGTISSIGTTFGNVAATALIPFVDLANNIVGAISELPAPVKQAGAALILMAGSLTVATVGLIAFNAALATTQVQSAIGGITAFAGAMKAMIPGAATVAIVALSQLKAAVVALNAIQVPSLAVMAATLKGSFVGALAAAKGAVVAFAGAVVGGMESVAASIQKNALFLWGLVKILVPIGFSILTYNKTLGQSKQVSEDFAESQKSVSAAIAELNQKLGESVVKVQESRNAWQQFWEGLREEYRLMELQKQMGQLEEKLNGAHNAAIAFYQELKKSGGVTDDQKNKAKAYAETLETLAKVTKERAAALREQSAAEAAAGNADLAARSRERATQLEAETRASTNLAAAIRQQAGITTQATAATDANSAATAKAAEAAQRAAQAVKDRAEAEKQLNQVIREAPIRQADAQIAVGQQLLSLSQALTAQEQSRFAIVRGGLEFELAQAEKRGASERTLRAIKGQIAEVDRQASEARYRSLLQEQQIQVRLLELSQLKARLDTGNQALAIRGEILKLEGELIKANASGEAEVARNLEAQIALKGALLSQVGEQAALLAQVQPLEQAILAAQQQTAINGERAKAAQQGYKIAADGSLVAINAIAGAAGNVGVITNATALEQERLRNVAAATGVAIQQAADGSIVLGRSQAEVAAAATEINRQLSATTGNLGAAAGGSAGLSRGVREAAVYARMAADGSIVIGQELRKVVSPAAEVSSRLNAAGQGQRAVVSATEALNRQLSGTATAADKASKTAGGIGKNLEGAGKIDAFSSTTGKAPVAIQGARDFAGWLSSSKALTQEINRLPLAQQFSTVASRTEQSARAAKSFYEWLERASRLPGARWTGGPVDAGETYRVNELGQEALLSGGRLSLIGAAPNSIWRAPSSGTVIPAGITSRLQEQGVLPSRGSAGSVPITPGGNSNAALAVEIGKLRQEVGELVRKQWNVNIQTKTGPTGSQVMQQMLR